MRRVSLAALIAFALLGCDADPLAPRHGSRPDAAAARVSAPTLSAAATSGTQTVLSWPDNLRNEDGWEVWRSSSGATGTFALLASLGPNSTMYTDGGLTPVTEYCYNVRSFRKTGSNRAYGAFFTPSCATTLAPPPPPTNVNAAFGDNPWVSLTWASPSSAPNTLRVQRSGNADGPWTTLADVAGTATTYTDHDVVAEQQYCYRVTSITFSGEGPSNVDCAVRPNAPTNVLAVSRDAQSVDVSWTDNSKFEAVYEIERSLNAWTVDARSSVDANVTTYHDGNVASNTRYWYRLRAKSADAVSPYSAWATAVPVSGPPAAPSIGLVPDCSTCVTASGIVSGGTEGVRVERSAGGSGWVAAATVLTTSDYWWLFERGRTTEQQVCYRATAFNSAGDSPVSAERCTTPPAPPSDVYYVGVDGGIEVRWTNRSAVAAGFLVTTYFVDYSGESCDGYVCRIDHYYDVPDPNATKTVVPVHEIPWYVCTTTREGGCSDYVILSQPPEIPVGNSRIPNLLPRLSAQRPSSLPHLSQFVRRHR